MHHESRHVGVQRAPKTVAIPVAHLDHRRALPRAGLLVEEGAIAPETENKPGCARKHRRIEYFGTGGIARGSGSGVIARGGGTSGIARDGTCY